MNVMLECMLVRDSCSEDWLPSFVYFMVDRRKKIISLLCVLKRGLSIMIVWSMVF